jgi:hypothetical protein
LPPEVAGGLRGDGAQEGRVGAFKPPQFAAPKSL